MSKSEEQDDTLQECLADVMSNGAGVEMPADVLGNALKLLDRANMPCLTYDAFYHKFQYCPSTGRLRQIENDDVSKEFSLGQVAGGAKVVEVRACARARACRPRRRANDAAHAQNHLEETFTGGSLCAEHGPRETTVRWYCDARYDQPYLYGVNEPALCRYQFDVYTARLCELEEYFGVAAAGVTTEDCYERYR